MLVAPSPLAQALIRRLPDAESLVTAAGHMADDLEALGRLVPDDDWLIVGGSMARGEPTFIHYAGDRLLVSDIDLMYVHYGDRPSMRVGELRQYAARRFPAVDLITLPLTDFRILQTELGCGFKNAGLALTEHGLPAHEPVLLDERDAYEILLYSIQSYFWLGLFDQWVAGTDSTDFHMLINQLCTRVLYATAMLDGATAHHDLENMAPHVAQMMRAELLWRTDPTQLPLEPGRFWSYVYDSFRQFDEAFGRPRPDAVHWTRYAMTRSGKITARHHQIVSELARNISSAWRRKPDLHLMDAVEERTWRRIGGATRCLRPGGPHGHFRAHRQQIANHLLAMKLQIV